MGHTEKDLSSTVRRGQLDCLVQHRDHGVQAFDRELLLPQVRPAEIALEAFDLGEARQQALLLVGRELLVIAARFDRPTEPHALFVARDVLDLVGHRPAVGLA